MILPLAIAIPVFIGVLVLVDLWANRHIDRRRRAQGGDHLLPRHDERWCDRATTIGQAPRCGDITHWSRPPKSYIRRMLDEGPW